MALRVATSEETVPGGGLDGGKGDQVTLTLGHRVHFWRRDVFLKSPLNCHLDEVLEITQATTRGVIRGVLFIQLEEDAAVGGVSRAHLGRDLSCEDFAPKSLDVVILE